MIWAAGAALALAMLLATGLIALGLLQSGGKLALASEEAALAESITGIAVERGTDLGLRPLVWAVRGTFWEQPLAALYRVPVFQNNLPALLALLGCGILLTILIRWLLLRARNSAERAGLAVATRLRRSLHRQALRIGPGDILDSDQAIVTDLFTKNTDDVSRAVANRVYVLATALAQIAAILAVALLVDWRVSLQCFIPLGCGWFLFVRFRKRGADVDEAASATLQDELARLSEGFAKTRIIRGYGMENADHRQFLSDLDEHHSHHARVASRRRRDRWLVCAMALAAAFVVLFFIGIKLLRVSADEAGFLLAESILLMICAGALYLPVRRLSDSPTTWRTASKAAQAIYGYVDRIPEVSQAVGAKFLQPLSNSLQFESVVCEIAGRGHLLDGIDMRLPAGQIYAFVSLDPLPARLLAYLLPRFVEPKSGRVLVDGNDIAWVTLESLRAETAYAGGPDPIFTGTVLENIRCGNDHRTLQDITAAAKTVHAHKFISQLPQGYETRLGHQGHRLDAGQSFRLSLARALLNDPALLIIEEPQEPLDSDAKTLLDDAYNRILGGRTVVFLPSRLSTVRRADGIALIHGGKVVAVGKHQNLVSSSPLYRHWEYSRFNEFRDGGES